MRLLMHEKVRDRNRSVIEALDARVEVVLMSQDGKLTLNRTELSESEAQPEVVFASTDVFFTPVARSFMMAALKSHSLKWVQSGSAGIDHPVFAQIVRQGVRLTTSHGQAVGMADYVVWGVLDVLQDGPARRRAQANGEWLRKPFREIADTRWLVVGFGDVGQGVGRRARAFGAHVTGIRRNAAPDPNADAIVALDQLTQLLPNADVVVLAIPMTPQTKGMADKTFFGSMKPGSILVNIGRGELVDEHALLAALSAGIPEHAVLDVFEEEPLPQSSPLWTHPRVTMTPHSSGLSLGGRRRNDELFFSNLNRYLTGAPLLNETDPKEILANAGVLGNLKAAIASIVVKL